MRDPLKSYPGYLLRRAASSLTTELTRRLADLDLRIADVSILLLIDANAGITQSELGRILDIQRANMTPMTAKLSERGMVTREAVDGRSQGLTLTATGKAMAAQARAIADTFEQDLVDRVPIELRPHILPILSALWSPEV
jgi:DNA-binding MarR family transcriptional regulator